MKNLFIRVITLAACIFLFSGCATYQAQKIGPTPIMHAETEIPEDQLMDVGILVFKSEELTEEQAEYHGTQVRRYRFR